MMADFILLGASGHSKVIIDMLHRMSDRECEECKIALLDDDEALLGTEIMGHSVIGKIEDCVLYPERRFIISIGNNDIREKLSRRYCLNYATAIHPSSIIGRNVTIGEGTVVMPGAIINSGTKIGKHCIINTGATIDHDNWVDDYVHISPGVHLAGTVSVGKKTWMGVGSSCLNNITIGPDVIVGGGSTVIRNIEVSGTYVGTPARRVSAG